MDSSPAHDGYFTTLRALLFFALCSTVMNLPLFMTSTWNMLIFDTVLNETIRWTHALGMLGSMGSFVIALVMLWRKRWYTKDPYHRMSGAAYTLEVRGPDFLFSEHEPFTFDKLYKRMTRLVEPITARPLHVHSIVLVRKGVSEITRAAINIDFYAPVAHTTPLTHRLYMNARHKFQALQDRLLGIPKTTRAYITFETTAMRNTAMRNSSRPLCDRLLATTPEGDISVRPAPNPKDILWENIDHGLFSQATRLFITSAVLLLISYVTFYALVFLYSIRFEQNSNEPSFMRRQVQLFIPSLVVSFLNWSIPKLIKVFAITFERWHTHTIQEISMMNRMVLLRIMLHVLCVLAAAPTLSRLDAFLMRDLAQIARGLIVSEWTLGSLLRFLDPYTLFLRHIMSPLFARNRTERDWFFAKPRIYISERYTDILKTIIVANVFAPCAPIVFPILALHIYTTYQIDRRLMTTYWERIDFLGPTLHTYVRLVLTLLLIGQAATTGLLAHTWSGNISPPQLRTGLVLTSITVIAMTLSLMAYIFCSKGSQRVLERCCLGHIDGPVTPGSVTPGSVNEGRSFFQSTRVNARRTSMSRQPSVGISALGLRVFTISDLYKPDIEIPPPFIDARQYCNFELQERL